MKKIMLNTRVKTYLFILLPVIMMAICILTICTSNGQATMCIPYPLQLDGEYSWDGVNWYPLEENSEFSAFAGELRVRGKLDVEVSEPARIYYFRNHIGLSVYRNDERIYVGSQAEVIELGIPLRDYMCGNEWNSFLLQDCSEDDIFEFRFVNHHKFGNKTAYNEALQSLYLSPDTDEVMNEYIKTYKQPMQALSLGMSIIGILLIGGSFASLLLQDKSGGKFLRYGILVLLGGGLFYFDNIYAFTLLDRVAENNYGRLLSIVFFVYFIDLLTAEILSGKRKRIAEIAVALSLLTNCTFLIWVLLKKYVLYDIMPFWGIGQCILSPLLLVLCVREYLYGNRQVRKALIARGALLLSICMDLTTVFDTVFSALNCTKLTFFVTFIGYLVATARRIILDNSASNYAKKLEKELAEQRIAIMLSQIQPHFIYNTLGTIGQFCMEEPKKAADLVREFSMYLRGNFTELDNAKPIPVSKELEHTKHYVEIEKVRFPDIQVEYDIKADDFLIPSLTIQPLVENAIKHGLMGLESGGKVEISTRELKHEYHVYVKDDGVGFSESVFEDGRRHVGISNIRERIETICNGSVHIDSEIGKGTVATIIIPKGEEGI